MIIKRIKPELFDQLMVAKLSKNKVLYQELTIKYKDDLFEEMNISEEKVIHSLEEIDYIPILLEKGLEEYDEGIYAGVAYSNLYEFDFYDQSVTVSLNLLDHYVLFPEYKRVWYYSDLYKNSYLYANYETGEIITLLGPNENTEKIKVRFNSKTAINEILKFVHKNNLNELFYRIIS